MSGDEREERTVRLRAAATESSVVSCPLPTARQAESPSAYTSLRRDEQPQVHPPSLRFRLHCVSTRRDGAARRPKLETAGALYPSAARGFERNGSGNVRKLRCLRY